MNSITVSGSEQMTTLKDLLKINKLPSDDIQLDGNLFLLYQDDSGKIIGSGGLEFYGNYCLLRSLATSAGYRKQGYGKRITADLLKKAKEMSAKEVYLLTETAQPFFERIGFKNESREDAPNEIKRSSEFSSVCPVSAVLMKFSLE